MQTDPLSDVLQMIRPRMAAYDVGHLQHSWGIRMRAVEGASFFVVCEGHTLLGTSTLRAPLHVRGGDVVLLPHGDEAWLKDEEERPLSALDARPFAHHTPQDPLHAVVADAAEKGATTAVVIAGIIAFDKSVAVPLLQCLPSVVLLSRQQTTTGRWLAQTVGLLDRELRDSLPGSQAIVEQIFGTLFAQTLRALACGEARSFPSDTLPKGLIHGLRDPAVARALNAFHQDPSGSWTVQKLANEACVSRTTFATRFKKRMGVPPMQYIRQHRIHQAALILKRRTVTVSEVAWDVGYESSSSFIKAFQREMGCSPSEHRG
jgi:AraC-like DNA-binding protein